MHLIKKNHIIIYPSKSKDFEYELTLCLKELSARLEKSGENQWCIFRGSAFIRANNKREYQKKSTVIYNALKQRFHLDIVPVSIVSQAPVDDFEEFQVAFEFDLVENDGIISIEYHYSHFHNVCKIISLKTIELAICSVGTGKENKHNISNITEERFKAIEKILKEHDFSFDDVLRQWNYINEITSTNEISGEYPQNYQALNNIRANHFSRYDFKNGYPAATGIGVRHSEVLIDVIAARYPSPVKTYSISNPLQKNAHQYNADVLIGKENSDFDSLEPPMFERAKLIIDKSFARFFVSGTASIKGQHSFAPNDVILQTITTLKNIKKLYSEVNLQEFNVTLPDKNYIQYNHIRVYLKKPEHVAHIEKICRNFFKTNHILYLQADICREELLVEIECIIEMVL